MKKYQEDRPWGCFEQFCKNEKVTVKIITVHPQSRLSLQYHQQREEFWKVISGEGLVVLDGQELEAQVGDEFFIPVKAKHRMVTKDKAMQIMEISFGEFDEKDIVRLSDDYGR